MIATTIQLWCGSVGSGKTLMAVKLMQTEPQERFYSNIDAKLPNCHLINADMIVHKNEVGQKRSGQRVYEYNLNTEFWKGVPKPCSCILDEAHSIINSRKAMSKVNILATEWLALIRRVIGEDSRGMGDLILISQLPMRVDVIAREMATLIKHHTMHFFKRCKSCGCVWPEHSEMPEQRRHCPGCDSADLLKFGHYIEIKKFAGINAYNMWSAFKMETYMKPIMLEHNVQEYFGSYDSWSWENMFGSLY